MGLKDILRYLSNKKKLIHIQHIFLYTPPSYYIVLINQLIMAEFNPELDSILPPVLFQFGAIKKESFDHLINIIANSMDIEPSLDTIRETMKSCPQAVVYNKNTKKVYEKPEKRICNRHTFGIEYVDAMSPIIIEMIQDCWDEELIPEDIQIHPDHGDVMYYPEGGKFNYHRDELLECPYGEGYDFYSLILCLDSRGYTGDTRVQVPPQEALMNMRINPSCIADFRGKHLATHTFNESRSPLRWVMFPSQSLHSGGKIVGKDNFKMCLKLDVWIKYPTLTDEFLDERQFIYRLDMWQEDYDEEAKEYEEIEREQELYGEYNGYGNSVDECNGYMDRW